MKISAHSGYVFLVTILVIGAVAAGAVAAFLLIGTSSLQSARTVELSAQALSNAQTCFERGLQNLRADLTYTGGQKIVLATGSCAILPVGGSGNVSRSFCVEGSAGPAIRRIEGLITQVLPSTLLSGTTEVATISRCAPLP